MNGLRKGLDSEDVYCQLLARIRMLEARVRELMEAATKKKELLLLADDTP